MTSRSVLRLRVGFHPRPEDRLEPGPDTALRVYARAETAHVPHDGELLLPGTETGQQQFANLVSALQKALAFDQIDGFQSRHTGQRVAAIGAAYSAKMGRIENFGAPGHGCDG